MKRFAISIPQRVHYAAISVYSLLMRYYGSFYDKVIAKTGRANISVGKVARTAPQKMIATNGAAHQHKRVFVSSHLSARASVFLHGYFARLAYARKAIIAMVGTKLPQFLIARLRILDELDLMILSALDQTKLCDLDYHTIEAIEEGGGQ